MTRSPKKRTSVFLESVPRELVTEILSRVAADSVADISNVKLSCKELKDTAEDPLVYQHASLDKFATVQWFRLTEAKLNFLRKCGKSGNPELLYREAIVDFFDKLQYQSAYQKLDKAVKLGHIGAFYTTCIILLYSDDDEQRRKGIRLIGSFKKSKSLKRKLEMCRKKFIDGVRETWMKNPIFKDRPRFCSAHRYKSQSERGWEEDDDGKCDACSADREVRFISDKFCW